MQPRCEQASVEKRPGLFCCIDKGFLLGHAFKREKKYFMPLASFSPCSCRQSGPAVLHYISELLLALTKKYTSKIEVQGTSSPAGVWGVPKFFLSLGRVGRDEEEL